MKSVINVMLLFILFTTPGFTQGSTQEPQKTTEET